MSDKVIDLNAVKTFFDPNPAKRFCGAEVPIPAAVKKVADELNGKTMSLADAVAKIQSATQGKGEVVILEDCIALYSIPRNSPLALKYALHIWRVIRFK